MAPLVPVVIIGGQYWPYLGWIAITLLAIMVTLTFFKGRYYCGWICAMGAFHERILARFSLHKAMLPLFKQNWFRWFLFAAMMSLLASRLVMTGGNPEKIGGVFVMMWTLSTSLAIGLGLIWKPRSWCSTCPMAIFQGMLAPKTYQLEVSDDCKECGACSKACPIETNPGSYKSVGKVKGSECLRCGNCVLNCPQGAIGFPRKITTTNIKETRGAAHKIL